MIDKTDVYKIARKKGFPAGVIEKEHMLTLFLRELAKRNDKFLFKGGTALSKVYLDYFRMSEDLDFTYNDESCYEAKKTTHTICEYLNLEIKDENETKYSYNASIKFVGPLQYQNYIKIDVSTREKPILKPKKVKINSFYATIEPFEVNVLDLRELLAEKIRTLIQRSKPRDYFDVWFLLKNKKIDATEIKNLVIEKCNRVNIEYTPNKIFSDIKLLKVRWKKDLVYLVKELPDFDVVLVELKKELEFL